MHYQLKHLIGPAILTAVLASSGLAHANPVDNQPGVAQAPSFLSKIAGGVAFVVQQGVDQTKATVNQVTAAPQFLMNAVEATTRQVQPNGNPQLSSLRPESSTPSANFLPNPSQLQGNAPKPQPSSQSASPASIAPVTMETPGIQRSIHNVVADGTKPQGTSLYGAKTLSTLPEAIRVTFNPEKKPGDLSFQIGDRGGIQCNINDQLENIYTDNLNVAKCMLGMIRYEDVKANARNPKLFETLPPSQKRALEQGLKNVVSDPRAEHLAKGVALFLTVANVENNQELRSLVQQSVEKEQHPGAKEMMSIVSDMLTQRGILGDTLRVTDLQEAVVKMRVSGAEHEKQPRVPQRPAQNQEYSF